MTGLTALAGDGGTLFLGKGGSSGGTALRPASGTESDSGRVLGPNTLGVLEAGGSPRARVGHGLTFLAGSDLLLQELGTLVMGKVFLRLPDVVATLLMTNEVASSRRFTAGH